MKIFTIVIILLFIFSCSQKKTISDLPIPVTNNAVAISATKSGFELYSFNGLSAGKTWQDIHNYGYRYHKDKWSKIKMPKSSQAVLASTAVSIEDDIYVMGGYTVAEDTTEKSMPEIFKLNTKTQKWSTVTTMPVPVDDTVALVYANRYIYLVSGWHDDDNVSYVQVYDTKMDKWFKATSYPAPAVFGHAGGIIENVMLICDGVKVVPKGETREFVSSPVCLKGVIDQSQPSKINWQDIPHHSGTAYYRMAAAGYIMGNKIVFAGGSDNPYNFNGIGYNGIPSQASTLVFSYDLTSNKWIKESIKLPANMDHRSLLNDKDKFYIVGGMQDQQTVSSKVLAFKLK